MALLAHDRPQNKSTAEFDTEGFTDRPFVDFLLSCSLSPELQAIVAYAVAGIPMCQSGFVAAAASPTGKPISWGT